MILRGYQVLNFGLVPCITVFYIENRFDFLDRAYFCPNGGSSLRLGNTKCQRLTKCQSAGIRRVIRAYILRLENFQLISNEGSIALVRVK